MLLILGSAGVITPRLLAQTNNVEAQFWPEFDFYWKLTDSTRLLLMSAATKDQDVENRKVDFGAYVDFKIPRLESLHLRRISLLDETRIHKVSFRAGYRYVLATDAKTPKVENRLQTDVTLRWGLPASLLLSNRNRVEYRFINGVFSWRYRLQAKIERDFQISRLTVIPFLSAELFYDSTYSAFSRWRYEAGLTVPVRRWAIQPYYAHQVVKHSIQQQFDAAGLTIIFYGH